MPRGAMNQASKEELRDKIKQLNEKLKTLENENEELKNIRDKVLDENRTEVDKLKEEIYELNKEKESRKGDADYISWLQLNCEHLSRFIRENVEVNTEVDYDYYGNASDPYSSLEIRKPSELE